MKLADMYDFIFDDEQGQCIVHQKLDDLNILIIQYDMEGNVIHLDISQGAIDVTTLRFLLNKFLGLYVKRYN